MSSSDSYIQGALDASNISTTIFDLNSFPNSTEIIENGISAITDADRDVFFNFLKDNNLLDDDITRADMNNPDMDQVLIGFINNGISALRVDDNNCIVLHPHETEDSKDEILGKYLADLYDPQKMPGTDQTWFNFFGHHEGGHCNAEEKPEDNNFWTLREEYIRADITGIKALIDAGHHDVAQAVIDIRILGTVMAADVEHSTGFALTAYPSLPQPTWQDFDRMEAMPKIILNALGVDIYDLTPREAADKLYEMYQENPQEFYNNIKSAYENGAFNADVLEQKFPELSYHPILKEMVADFMGAMGRRAKDVQADPLFENEAKILPPLGAPVNSGDSSHSPPHKP